MDFIQHPMKLFGLKGSEEYAKEVADALSIKLSTHEERVFDDGEPYLKSSDGKHGNVRGHNCFVIQSLYGDDELTVSERFTRLLIFIGSLKQASANEVIPVIPHLGWARQDRKTASRAPVTTKIIAKALQDAGGDRFLFFDVHNKSAIENAFDVPIDNLEAKPLHADWCAKKLDGAEKIVVMSPDAGGLGRAERFRTALHRRLPKSNIGLAVFDKLRDSTTGEARSATGGKSVGNIIGDVQDALVIMLDDMISTCGTMIKACRAVPEFGGKVYAICVTHGLFVGKANERLTELADDTKIVIADTIPPFRVNKENRKRVRVVKTTDMVAEAISKINSGTGSISELINA